MARIDVTKTELVWPGKYDEGGKLREPPLISSKTRCCSSIRTPKERSGKPTSIASGEIHRWVLAGQSIKVIRAAIPGLFDDTFRNLADKGLRPINPHPARRCLPAGHELLQPEPAEMRRIREAEVDVSLEKEDYILTGKVDLLMGEDDKLELLRLQGPAATRA